MARYYLAIIDESTCIGCTKCIQVCPFDAIIGASKQIHTVLKKECTGCNLCVAPCPVDCIEMVETAKPLFDYARAKQRRRARRNRLQQHDVTDQKMELTKENFAVLPSTITEAKATIAAAVARVKQRRQFI